MVNVVFILIIYPVTFLMILHKMRCKRVRLLTMSLFIQTLRFNAMFRL